MQGQITKYRDDLGFGIIETDDGRRYRFTKQQVKNSAEALIGQDVDFVLSARRPVDIIMMSGSPWSAFGGLGERE
jgi:cold shock CspA family protein